MEDSQILEIEDLDHARLAWRTIFSTKDPFVYPFKENARGNFLVLFPTEGYHLTEEQFEAVLAISRQASNDFYVTDCEYQGDFFVQGKTWRCANPAYEDYLNLPLVLENSLYDINGNWGLLVSHEDHAIVGATGDLLSIFKDAYPKWEQDKNDLLEHWAENENRAWLDGLYAGS